MWELFPNWGVTFQLQVKTVVSAWPYEKFCQSDTLIKLVMCKVIDTLTLWQYYQLSGPRVCPLMREPPPCYWTTTGAVCDTLATNPTQAWFYGKTYNIYSFIMRDYFSIWKRNIQVKCYFEFENLVRANSFLRWFMYFHTYFECYRTVLKS